MRKLSGTAVGVTSLVAVVAVGVVAAIALGTDGGHSDADVATAPRASTQSPTPGPPAPPPTMDVQALVTQERIPVADSNGNVRGTVPNEIIFPEALPPGQEDPPTATPVLSARGKVNGYWVTPYVGFVERDVVETADFDIEQVVAEGAAEHERDLAEACSNGEIPPDHHMACLPATSG